MGVLLAASVKMVVRDRQAIFWALFFPVIFLGVFRLFSFDTGGTTRMVVVTDTATEVGATLAGALDAVDFLEVEVPSAMTQAEALDLLQTGEVDAVLLAPPAEDGAAVRAELVHGIDDPIGSAMTVAAIESVVDHANLELTGAPRAIELQARSAQVEQTSFFEFLGPGIIGMGLMNFATISLAGSLSRYREEGVLRRIRATPLPPWRFFSSVIGAHLLVAFVQVLVLALVAEALGGNVLRGGVPFILVAVFGTLIFLNLGVIIAGRVQGRGAVEGAANAITLPMMFLSGSFFPTSALPSAVQPFVELLPLTHMLTALRGLALDGDSLIEQWPALAVMALWVLGTFALARVAFSFEEA